ncbi:endonuclease [Marinicella sp. W31]|uniref:endonuclease n=1 Tax=Marinicella sp. W31 TaxID=3023713 RepID=UPI003756EA52
MHPTILKKIYCVLLLSVSFQAMAQAPTGYYNSANTSNPSALRNSLHQIIDDHQRYPYTSSSTDTWDVLEIADEDQTNSGRISTIYRNASYSKQGGGNSYYNREHTWPKSYGFPNDGASNYPYTDMHHLFLADSGYNSSRSNKPFDVCTSNCSQKSTNFNDGRGGNGSSDANFTKGSFTNGVWDVWNGRRGDIARAMFYMDVRYEGGNHGVTGYSEPDLILTDNRSLIANSNNGSNRSVAYMGLLSVLILWHEQDPVDDIERQHMEAVAAFQGNRNPFVDHPEWVECVFELVCNGSGGGNGGGNDSVYISEIHYDNSGSDYGEFIEITGPAGTNLSGWKVLGYNGSNRSVYKTINLSGTLSNQSSGLGARAFDVTGLQNGSPDGLALINPNGNVVEFISYEGSFTASNGTAAGVTSTDIGVRESNTTPRFYSLQRNGSSNNWSGPSPESYGVLN